MATPPNTDTGLFPLNFRQDLQIAQYQQATLQAIFLTTPIHIHTPLAHIGTVHSDLLEEKIDAIGLIHYLRAGYEQMSKSTEMQAEAPSARLLLPSATEFWNKLISAERSDDSPLDPLLGNTEVWGLEPVSFEGYSVVHVA